MSTPGGGGDRRAPPAMTAVAVAVKGDLSGFEGGRGSRRAVRWAVDNLVPRADRFVLVHVMPRVTAIPTPSTFPRRRASRSCAPYVVLAAILIAVDSCDVDRPSQRAIISIPCCVPRRRRSYTGGGIGRECGGDVRGGNESEV